MDHIVEYKHGQKWLLLMGLHASASAAKTHGERHFRGTRTRIRVKPVSALDVKANALLGQKRR
jgi:hypothetical protein